MMRLTWASYFASRANVPPMPPMQVSLPASAGLFADLADQLPSLHAGLAGIRVPMAVLVGERKPDAAR